MVVGVEECGGRGEVCICLVKITESQYYCVMLVGVVQMGRGMGISHGSCGWISHTQWGEHDGEGEEWVVQSVQALPSEHWLIGEHPYFLCAGGGRGGGGGQLYLLPWRGRRALYEGLSLRCDPACM